MNCPVTGQEKKILAIVYSFIHLFNTILLNSYMPGKMLAHGFVEEMDGK